MQYAVAVVEEGSPGNTAYVAVDPRTSYCGRPQGVLYKITGTRNVGLSVVEPKKTTRLAASERAALYILNGTILQLMSLVPSYP